MHQRSSKSVDNHLGFNGSVQQYPIPRVPIRQNFTRGSQAAVWIETWLHGCRTDKSYKHTCFALFKHGLRPLVSLKTMKKCRKSNLEMLKAHRSRSITFSTGHFESLKKQIPSTCTLQPLVL
eukprot:5711941-Amphidinium_carterae.1